MFISTGCHMRNQSAGIRQFVELIYIVIIKKDNSHTKFSGFQREVSRKQYLNGRFLWEVHCTCRRGPHLCPCSPTLPRNKLVERTSGVSGPSYLLSMSTRQYPFLRNRYKSSYSTYIFVNKDHISSQS